jgi:hypothetical protein
MYHVLGSHTYAAPGVYDVSVEVLQGWGAALAVAENGEQVGDAPKPPAQKKSHLIVAGNAVPAGSDVYKRVLGSAAARKNPTAAKEILDVMIKSMDADIYYRYASVNDLENEVKLRLNVIAAAKQLWDLEKPKKEHTFSFDNTKNIVSLYRGRDLIPSEYWGRILDAPIRGLNAKNEVVTTRINGIGIKPGKSPAAAVGELFDAAALAKQRLTFGYDCFTAVYLAAHRGLATTLGSREYDAYVTKKNDKPSLLILASTYHTDYYLSLHTPGVKYDRIPGDIRTFINPGSTDANYQNENTIYLGGGNYFAPFLGILNKQGVKDELNNKSRTKKADETTDSERVIYPR